MKLGDIAKDTVTGFTGMIIGHATYLYNVDRLVLQPRELRDGKSQDSRSFDEPGLEFVGPSEVKPVKPATDDYRVGDIVRDRITGFEGIVVIRTQWLSGCFTITIQPQGLNKDGEPYDSKNYEEPDCILVKSHKMKAPARKVGGPKPELKRFER